MIRKIISATSSSTLRSDKDNIIILHDVAGPHQSFTSGMCSIYLIICIYIEYYNTNFLFVYATNIQFQESDEILKWIEAIHSIGWIVNSTTSININEYLYILKHNIDIASNINNKNI